MENASAFLKFFNFFLIEKNGGEMYYRFMVITITNYKGEERRWLVQIIRSFRLS
jgi:hypothetical protein